MKKRVYGLYDETDEQCLCTGTIKQISEYLNRSVESLKTSMAHQNKEREYYLIRYKFKKYKLYDFGLEDMDQDEIKQSYSKPRGQYKTYVYNLYTPLNDLKIRLGSRSEIINFTKSDLTHVFWNGYRRKYKSSDNIVNLKNEWQGWKIERVERGKKNAI